MVPEDFHRNTHRYKTKQSLPEAHKDARHSGSHASYQWLTQTCFMKNPQDKTSSRHRENPRATDKHRDPNTHKDTQIKKMQAHGFTQHSESHTQE